MLRYIYYEGLPEYDIGKLNVGTQEQPVFDLTAFQKTNESLIALYILINKYQIAGRTDSSFASHFQNVSYYKTLLYCCNKQRLWKHCLDLLDKAYAKLP